MVINSPLGKQSTRIQRPVRPRAPQGPQGPRITASLSFGHRSGPRGSLFKVQTVYRTLRWVSFNRSPQGKGSVGSRDVFTWSLCSPQPVPSSPRPGTQDPRIICLSGPRLLSGAVWASSLGPSFQGQTTLQWVGPQAWGHYWKLDVWAVMSRYMSTWSLAVEDGAGDSHEPISSAPLESENSKFKLGLPDHVKIYCKAGG